MPTPALVPATPWLAESTPAPAPAAPRASLGQDTQGQPTLHLWAARGSTLRTMALRIRRGSTWRLQLLPAPWPTRSVLVVPLSADDNGVLVQGIDRLGQASAVLALRRGPGGWSFT
jgi:hypothetical protein